MKTSCGILLAVMVTLICLTFPGPCFAFQEDEWKKPYRGTGQKWENNQLGVSEKVPKPWIPVTHENNTLQCWGRKFVFSDGFLFDQVISQGENLFTTPPMLKIAISGRQVSDRGITWKVTEKNDIGITMQATSDVSNTARVTMRVRLEFDGFIRFDLKFSPLRAITLDHLRLELPMTAASAQMYSKYLAYDYNKEVADYDSLKTCVGYLNRSVSFPFSPTFWIGNREVGLEWVCDTNINWQPKNIKTAHEIIKAKAGYLFTANIVETPKTISEDIIYSFGFYATPVKRAIPNWRQYFFADNLVSIDKVASIQKHKPYVIIFPWIERECPLKVHGMPAPYDSGQHREKYEAYRKQLSSRSVGYVPYTKLYSLSKSPDIPEKYWDMWKMGKERVWSTDSIVGGTRDIQVTMYQKSIQDFYIYKISHAIKEHKVNGVYIDISTPEANLVSKLYGLDKRSINKEGKTHVPFFAHREYMKRLYIAAKELDKEFLLIPHTGKISQVVGAFAEFVISGESLNRVFMQAGGISKVRTKSKDGGGVGYSEPEKYVPDYFSLPSEIFEIDYFQGLGYKNIILPQIEKRNKEVLDKYPEREIKWSRSLLGNTLVYDLLIWGKRIHRNTYFAIVNLIDQFITLDDTVEHVPSDRAKNFFKVREAQGISLAAYRQENKIMVVGLNREEAPKDMTMTLPESWLPAGGKLKSAINAEAKTPLGYEDRNIKIPLKGKDFTIAFLVVE